MSSTRLSRAPPAIAVCGRESGRPCSGSPLGELFLEAVAAAKPTPLGVCPAGGGDQPRGSAPADSRLANKAQGCAPPEAGISRGDPLPRIPAWRASSRVAAAKPTPLGVCPAGGGDQAAGFGSCRIPPGEQAQGCAPPEAGIKPRDSAPAESRLASKGKVRVAAPSAWRAPPKCQGKDTPCCRRVEEETPEERDDQHVRPTT